MINAIFKIGYMVMTVPRRGIFSRSDMSRRYEMRKKKGKKGNWRCANSLPRDYTKLFSRDVIDSCQIKKPISHKMYCSTRVWRFIKYEMIVISHRVYLYPSSIVRLKTEVWYFFFFFIMNINVRTNASYCHIRHFRIMPRTINLYK